MRSMRPRHSASYWSSRPRAQAEPLDVGAHDLAAAAALLGDQAGPLEHRDVLLHRREAHGVVPGQLGDALVAARARAGRCRVWWHRPVRRRRGRRRRRAALIQPYGCITGSSSEHVPGKRSAGDRPGLSVSGLRRQAFPGLDPDRAGGSRPASASSENRTVVHAGRVVRQVEVDRCRSHPRPDRCPDSAPAPYESVPEVASRKGTKTDPDRSFSNVYAVRDGGDRADRRIRKVPARSAGRSFPSDVGIAKLVGSLPP